MLKLIMITEGLSGRLEQVTGPVFGVITAPAELAISAVGGILQRAQQAGTIMNRLAHFPDLMEGKFDDLNGTLGTLDTINARLATIEVKLEKVEENTAGLNTIKPAVDAMAKHTASMDAGVVVLGEAVSKIPEDVSRRLPGGERREDRRLARQTRSAPALPPVEDQSLVPAIKPQAA